ncbi:MAG TPA: TetR/AcrR family transcriptional regulator, partial [Bacteroidales bacterium]|nr:TetR/AcrR family transcriptional regulator [Bacteroidales bacterium]
MSEQNKISNEQLILEAAELEFFTKGYDGARTTSIAKKAGVTHAMLHYYYRTKEKLFECIIEKTINTVKQTMLAAMGNPDMPLIERLKDGIGSHFDLLVTNPLLPRFFLNEIISRPERYNLLYERVTGFAQELFANLQREIDVAAERGEIEKIDVRTLLLSIMSLNIFPFIAYQFVESVMGNLMANREKFLAERKAENIE